MADFTTVRNDFEARLRFLSIEEGGQQSPWRAQGYRCDFSYKDDMEGYYMIWPIFLDDEGHPLAEGTKVYAAKPVNARMTIINDQLRASEHRKRLGVGVEFYLREGRNLVMEGVVTRIADLFKD